MIRDGFLCLSSSERGQAPLCTTSWAPSRAKAAGPLPRLALGAVCKHFQSVAQAASCLPVSLGLFVTRQQITELPLTSEEPGLHAGASHGTGARLVPGVWPIPAGFGHSCQKKATQSPWPLCTPPAAPCPAALPGSPTLLQPAGKHKHCLSNSIHLPDVDAEPALCPAQPSVLLTTGKVECFFFS